MTWTVKLPSSVKCAQGGLGTCPGHTPTDRPNAIRIIVVVPSTLDTGSNACGLWQGENLLA